MQLKIGGGVVETYTMKPSDWPARAFSALDQAEGTACVLLSDDFVARWATSSWERIFGYDPIDTPAWDVVHPDDLNFTLSVLNHHREDLEVYAAPMVDELVPPSGEIRLRHADGRWLKCMVRIDNKLANPEVAAIVVHVVRPIDPSGLARAIDCITHAAPVEKALTAILGYMAEDGIRQNQGPSAVVWIEATGERRAVSESADGVAEVLFGREVSELPRGPQQVTITNVEQLPEGPLRSMAERMHLRCLWAIRIGAIDDELGVVLSWSAYDFALELRPHMHFAIGCDVVALALNERRRMHAIRLNAVTDPLTGVYNRAGLDEAFNTISGGHQANVGALFVDLDDFKDINDLHGHTVGDQVLTEVAGRLGIVCRETDVAARIGGDEFVMLCPNVDSRGMDAIAARVAAQFDAPIVTDAGPLRVWASVGVSSADRASGLTALLREADVAQYRAKRLAKNRRKSSQAVAHQFTAG
jgi:diguanylate cyclase (GGDEF)-like protein